MRWSVNILGNNWKQSSFWNEIWKYSTICIWMMSNAPEIAKRLHVKSEIIMGWKMFEKSFKTLKNQFIVWNYKGIVELTVNQFMFFPQSVWIWTKLNCFIATCARMYSLNKVIHSLAGFPFACDLWLIECKMRRISLTTATTNWYAPMKSDIVHATTTNS